MKILWHDRGQKGFATVYTVIIFSSLMLFMLTALVIANGYGASSVSQDLTFIAGRSVLSEFQPELYSRYGVFALKNRGDNLQTLFEYYVGKGLSGNGVIQLSAEDISADPGEHGGLNTKELSAQLKKLGALTAAKDMLSEADIISEAESAGEQSASGDGLRPGYESELEDLTNYSDAQYDDSGKCIRSESSTAKRTRQQAQELMKRYKEAVNYDGGAAGQYEKNKLTSSQLEKLPSDILGAKSLSPLLSGGISTAGAASVLENSYIVNACSNYINSFENTVFKNETEYILYGKNNDPANARAARVSLFGLRFSVNLAGIYSDPEKLEPITALAAASFYLIPTPLAVFMLASAQAGTEAKADVEALIAGRSVPLAKGSPIDSYKDYLGLMLIFLDEDVKLARLMDIMQLNIEYIDKTSFAFADYCYGFDVKVTYINKGVFSGLTGIGDRKKKIETSFVYK